MKTSKKMPVETRLAGLEAQFSTLLDLYEKNKKKINDLEAEVLRLKIQVAQGTRVNAIGINVPTPDAPYHKW